MVTGFLFSEGLVEEQDFSTQEDNTVYVDASTATQELSLQSSGFPGIFRAKDKLPQISAQVSYTLDECRNAFQHLEAEEYKRSRGYHIAALVDRGK